MKQFVIIIVALIFQASVYSQVEKNNYPFKVDIEGTGNPVILIPGLGCSGEVWNETVKTLKENYECHIFTLAGFSTEKPIDITNGFLPIIQNQITNYIKNELTEKPILVGHSLGGFMSLSIASTYLDLLKKIIIVDSYPFMSLAYNPNATEESVLPQANMMKDMLLKTPDSTYVKQQEAAMKTMTASDENAMLITKWSVESDRATIAQAMFELITTDLRGEVEKVTCPILVFGSWYGAKDYGITKEMVATNYKNQFSKAKNCTIKVAETAKHFVMFDEPAWFINEVNSFLNNEQ